MKFSDIRSVIVDLDGTMVDTLGDFVVALNHTLDDLRLPPVARDLVERTVGKGSEHLVRTVLAHQLALPEVIASDAVALSWPRDQVDELALQRYQHHYLFVNGQHADVYPGVVEGLQRLRASGRTLACLTNKPLAFAQALLEIKGLAGYFSQVFGGDSFERKKPDPLPLLKTCEALGTTPAQTLMVGDSQNDGIAARAAGCPVALVTYGYNHGDPIAEAPHDLLIGSLAELLD
ncbi:MAG: phosphoglycolate phosphatase [Burkholderiales bacterium RIFCSPLOWO2_12_67_14]|nr:MAG: phosphoglycolate phosphatase [Burkholderiales bacterium RIFCSPLOWO2_02_FULL_67_64]OGB50596.1 MAG: phosphoglycolate phosphatase [Burkholderiales bacterium RIFCSPLOWO2_12_67_14]OGB51824.1 MAG: phosphoglycolate phosphatase [Burkholderiales bacterium RIFCSPHIGHO2_12_FULL_67_38]